MGIFDGSEVCCDLFHFLSGVHWWEIWHEPHGPSGCVLGGLQYDICCHTMKIWPLWTYAIE